MAAAATSSALNGVVVVPTAPHQIHHHQIHGGAHHHHHQIHHYSNGNGNHHATSAALLVNGSQQPASVGNPNHGSGAGSEPSSTPNSNTVATTNNLVPNDPRETQQQPNSVLRVVIENMIYPVTLDILHSIFSRYGKVLRIITFNKNNTFQALIHLSEATAAQQAKQALDGHNVFANCCTLRIDYSKLATLNVKYNNDKSRDYTNPNLPAGDLTLEQQLNLVASGGLSALQSVVPSPFGFPFGAAPSAFLSPQQSVLSGAAAQLGVPLPVGLLSAAATAVTATPVVLVSNLDETTVRPDALFTLFGVYGDVVRVKILFNKKDNALIQYAEPQQAALAVQHLDKVRWKEHLMRVTASRHTNVQMPKEGQPDAGLTRDYTHSALHRFKKPGSKNYLNIYPPSATLHLSNIPASLAETQLLEAFEAHGHHVKNFKFFPKDRRMALVALADVDAAIHALVEMHNFKLAENAHLRVSFSKTAI